MKLLRGTSGRGQLEILDSEGLSLLLFDVTTEEQHGETADVTEHPVEDGSTITDHVQQKPVELTVRGVITNTPFGGDETEIVFDRDWYGWDRLREIKRKGELVQVVTDREVYSDMVITSISDAATAEQWVEPSITLRQVTLVSSKMVAIPAEDLKPRVRDQAAPEVDAGRQQTEALVQEALAQSEAYQFVLSISGGA